MDRATFGQFILSLAPTEVVDAQTSAVADEVATYFRQDKTLLYRGVAGLGSHGGAIIFAQLDEDRYPIRRIIVKYSLDKNADDDLRNEATWLAQLRGAEHIGQMIPLADTNLNVAGTGKRPTLALDFLENGTLEDFVDRYKRDHDTFPSRLMWRILFCLVRQRIAMAYPPRKGPNAPIETEHVRIFDQPYPMTQNSPHGRNLVIGDLTDDPEHNLVPRIHLIDFGRGRVEDTWQQAHETNLLHVGYAMLFCALCRIPPEDIKTDEMIEWRYFPRGFPRRFNTSIDRRFLELQFIDPVLRDLVARCMAWNAVDRPSLSELAQACERGLARSVLDIDIAVALTPELRMRESDGGIRALVKQYILDAPSADGRLPADRPIKEFPNLGKALLPVRPPDPSKVSKQGQPKVPIQEEESPETPRKTLFQGFQEWLNSVREEPDRMEIDEEIELQDLNPDDMGVD